MTEQPYHDPLDDEDECWNCGGEGVVYSCFEEWACIDPEGGCDQCMQRCDVCRPARRPEAQEEAS